MDQEFVSIVMLCYNHEQYLAKALDSVLMQKTKYSYKIVIGDDCSPDSSQSIILQYVDQYPDKFRAFCRQHNLGMNENFIDLIHQCKGKYVAYLECDDYWMDDHKLERQIDFLEKHPNYSAVTADYQCVDQDDNILRKRMSKIVHPVDYTYYDLKKFKQPGHMSTWLMRNIFQEGTCDIAHMLDYKHSTGDRILPILLLSKGKIRCFPDLVSCYRFDVRPESTSWSAKHNKALENGNFQDFERLEELEAYAATLDFPVLFTEKKKFYYGLALYYAYVHHNKGYQQAKRNMVQHMNHNIGFILGGYHIFFKLINNSIKLRFQKKGKSSHTLIDVENEG